MTESADDVMKLLTLTEVAERFGVSRVTVHSWIKHAPDFPLPVQPVPGGRSFYVLTEILSWRDRRRVTHAAAMESSRPKGPDSASRRG